MRFFQGMKCHCQLRQSGMLGQHLTEHIDTNEIFRLRLLAKTALSIASLNSEEENTYCPCETCALLYFWWTDLATHCFQSSYWLAKNSTLMIHSLGKETLPLNVQFAGKKKEWLLTNIKLNNMHRLRKVRDTLHRVLTMTLACYHKC